MMGIPSKAQIHLETARQALERSHRSKSKRPGYVVPEVSALRSEVSALRAAVDALLAALDIMALDPAPREPISERRYNADGEKIRLSGDLDCEANCGPDRPDEYKTMAQWAKEGIIVTPGRKRA